jgi:Restriction endonuclease
VRPLQSLYEALHLPADASARDKRQRGRAFETFLGEVLSRDGLSPRLRLRPSGEEIDGSFELDGKTYLLEAKWHAAPLPASEVYAFKGKVDGKLVGTIGLCVSMSGYGDDAVDALTAGKVLNVLLFDRADIEAALEHGMSRVLRAKLRAAAEEGVVLFPFTSLLAEVRTDHATEVAEVPTDASWTESTRPEVVVICEGSSAARTISILGGRVLEENGTPGTLRVVVAHGKQSVARLANALHPLVEAPSPIIAVIEGDSDATEAAQRVIAEARVPLEVIVVDPELEAWFYPDTQAPREAAKAAARREHKPLEQFLDELAGSVEIRDLLRSAPGFMSFYEAILRATRADDVPASKKTD